MVALKVLQPLQIASPCNASWADMAGDNKRRFCGQCDKFVYNLPELDTEEFVELVEKTEGRFCGRLFKRPDNTVLTTDCPVGVNRLIRKARMKARGRAGAIAQPRRLGSGLRVLFFRKRRCC